MLVRRSLRDSIGKVPVPLSKPRTTVDLLQAAVGTQVITVKQLALFLAARLATWQALTFGIVSKRKSWS